MLRQTFRVPAADGTPLHTYLWQPDAPGLVRAIVHIVHGMAEHAGRYDPAARHLTAAGYAVVAHDHRGHGRSAAHLSQLGHIGDDGFEKMVDDIGAVHAWTQRHLPQRPVFLLGHSMGSFLTLRYLERGARGLAGAILSGSGSQPLPLFRMGIWLAAQEMRRDPLAASPRLMRLTFAGFNRGLTPRRTAFDWLSRDPHAVDAFIQDPYCGAVMPAAFFYWFFRGLADTLDPRALRLIPHDLPLYLFSGARDPVGGRGLRGLRRLIAALRRHGVRDLTVRIYPGGRHEMLQETNRDEVLRDLVAWLDRHMP